MTTTNYFRQSIFINKDFLMGLIFNFPIFLIGVNYISLFLFIISLGFVFDKRFLNKKFLKIFTFITGLTIFSFVVTSLNNLNYAGVYKIGTFYIILTYSLFFISSINKLENFLKGYLFCIIVFFYFIIFQF